MVVKKKEQARAPPEDRQTRFSIPHLARGVGRALEPLLSVCVYAPSFAQRIPDTSARNLFSPFPSRRLYRARITRLAERALKLASPMSSNKVSILMAVFVSTARKGKQTPVLVKGEGPMSYRSLVSMRRSRGCDCDAYELRRVEETVTPKVRPLGNRSEGKVSIGQV